MQFTIFALGFHKIDQSGLIDQSGHSYDQFVKVDQIICDLKLRIKRHTTIKGCECYCYYCWFFRRAIRSCELLRK